ncbi:glycosyltransferase, partial [bacterium]
ILLVAYGNPASRQEKWIEQNLPKLPSVKVAMGVGGSFDFLAGNIARAPKWMQRIGIEWLWRLGRQPRRGKRIFRAVVVFSLSVLKDKLTQR